MIPATALVPARTTASSLTAQLAVILRLTCATILTPARQALARTTTNLSEQAVKMDWTARILTPATVLVYVLVDLIPVSQERYAKKDPHTPVQQILQLLRSTRTLVFLTHRLPLRA
jgi:hypothetical protein